MAYCKSCGMALNVGANFCGSCGAPAPVYNIKPAFRGLSDMWAWLLACTPMFYILLFTILSVTFFDDTLDISKADRYIAAAIFFVVSALFLFMDMRAIKKIRLSKRDNIIENVWLWIAASLFLSLINVVIGFIVISIYLILRTRKINVKYSYAILNCTYTVIFGAFILFFYSIFDDVGNSTASAQVVDTVSVQSDTGMEGIKSNNMEGTPPLRGEP